MAAQKKSVDEIWKELNARTSTRSSSTGFSGVPGVATKTRILPTKTPAQPPAAPPADVQHQIDVTKRNVNYDYSKAGVTSEDIQSYLSTIQRTVNCLSDPDRSTRRQAAQTLNARLFKGDASNPKPSPQLLQGLICGPLLHPLITLLSDHVEACRSSSLTTFTQAAESAPEISDACSRLFPGLAQRMGDLPVAEPSEECRLQVVQLVAALVQHLPAAALAAYRDELSAIMCRAFEDGYHEIKKQGCTILQQACGKLPAAGLEPQADKLLAALLPNLSHAHSKVRTAVLQALEALVAAGIPAGSMQQAVAPALKPLAVDRAPGVRETLFSTVATWLGHAGRAAAGASHKVDPSVAETYAPCLLPLLLLGTSDEQASTAAAAWQLVHSVGAALASTATTSSSTAAMDTEPSAAPAASSSGSELPASSRALVQRLLPQLLPPAIKELTEWTVALRSSAARTLHHMLLLAGQGSTGHLPALLPALCSAIGDEDVEVARRIMGCVQVLGAELQAQRWLPLLLDHLANSRLSAAQRANALVVLSGLLYASCTAGQQLPDDMVPALTAALVSDDLRACDHSGVRAQLLAVTENTMRCLGPRCGTASRELLATLLQLYGSEPEPERRAAISQALASLATHCSLASSADLTAAHAPQLLAAAVVDAESWSSQSPNYLLFRAVLQSCGQAMLAALLPGVAAVVQPAVGNHERDPQLRLGLLQLLDELLEDESKAGAFGGASAQLTLEQLLLPALVWHAGKVAAAVRFAGITALATFAGKRLVGQEQLVALAAGGQLLPLLFQCMDEDWYPDLRHTACHVLELLLLVLGKQLTAEQRRLVYPELLKRLDDSSNRVRLGACSALVALAAGTPADYCDTNSGYLAAGVVIHMDDSEAEVQEAACAVMEALAAVKPAVVAGEVRKVMERFRSKHYCARVLEACGAQV